MRFLGMSYTYANFVLEAMLTRKSPCGSQGTDFGEDVCGSAHVQMHLDRSPPTIDFTNENGEDVSGKGVHGSAMADVSS